MSQNPLFHPRVIAKALAAGPWPADLADRHRRIGSLLEMERSGELGRTLETELQGDYIKTVFESVLGYTTRLGGDGRIWHINPERNVLTQGRKATDGGIGWFEAGKDAILHAVLELKGAGQELDHARGRALTPVQQAWDYAVQSSTCTWILVSNYREVRLYHRARSQADFERIRLRDLTDLDTFKRFLLLFGRDRLLPTVPGARAPLDDMLDESDRVQLEITDQLYKDYRTLRAELFQDLCRAHSNLPPLDVLRHTQKLLDRVLFIAFAEDRQLLPRLLDRALKDDGFGGLWARLCRLFMWVDRGNPELRVSPYNGGLFAPDPDLDALEPPDVTLGRLRRLGEYDFAEDVSVDVLGHIFEQSITDLESLRASAAGVSDEGLSKRKQQGVYYTPAFVTRYIVQETLVPAFRTSLDSAMVAHAPDRVRGKNQQAAAWERVWMQHRATLSALRVLDPACGSGAFLVAAYDALAREYERVNQELATLRGGQRDVFDLNKNILQGNLYGVDLNPESIEITRLSLWLKTAQQGKKLTALDFSIVCGDSVCDDPKVAPRAFDWTRGRQVGDWSEPETDADRTVARAWAEGFDVVIGNPPYVRQELLSPALKDHLRARYGVWHGMADLFVYFFERGLDRLKPGGRLGFVVANKWLKGGYAEPLRGLLARDCRVERLIDFGHAPIFPDADAFPSIIVVQKGSPTPTSAVHAVTFPREELRQRGVEEFVVERSVSISQSELGSAPWSLEPPAVRALMERMRQVGVPLEQVAGKPMYGIKTGCNEAFVIDEATRGALLREDPNSAELIFPFLRGRDVDRWVAHRSDLYMIFARRGVEIERYPAILRHLSAYREMLEPKPDAWKEDWKGRKAGRYKWYEIQDTVDYWREMLSPKVIYPDLAWRPQFALDGVGMLTNDLCFFIPGGSSWLAAVLNSPVLWTYIWRNVIHGKDEVLRLKSIYMVNLPIPTPTPEMEREADALVGESVSISTENNQSTRDLLDWLRQIHGIDTPGRALEDFAQLEGAAFVAEVSRRRPKARGPLSPAALRELKQLHEAERLPMLQRSRRLLAVERQLSRLVNDAFGLKPEDVALIRKTAPPRTPPGLDD